MQSYTSTNPPRRGTARKIWEYLARCDIVVKELHYNPNCWGSRRENGWGTWACTIGGGSSEGYWCGWRLNRVYLQCMAGAYQIVWPEPHQVLFT